MNNPTYRKFGELPRRFRKQFDEAYLQFWRDRGMPPPDVQWRKAVESREPRFSNPKTTATK